MNGNNLKRTLKTKLINDIRKTVFFLQGKKFSGHMRPGVRVKPNELEEIKKWIENGYSYF